MQYLAKTDALREKQDGRTQACSRTDPPRELCERSGRCVLQCLLASDLQPRQPTLLPPSQPRQPTLLQPRLSAAPPQS